MTRSAKIGLTFILSSVFLLLSFVMYAYYWNFSVAFDACLIIVLLFILLARETRKIHAKYPAYLIVLCISILCIFFSSIIAIYAIKYGNGSSPVLAGDAQEYYEISKNVILSGKSVFDVRINYLGYPIFLTALFRLFSISVLLPLLINTCLLLLVIVRCGSFTLRLTGQRRAFYWTIILALGTSQFMSFGFMILKDVFIFSAVLLALEGSFEMLNKSSNFKLTIKLILSVAIFAIFRLTFIFVPILILVVVNPKSILRSVIFTLFGALFVSLSLGIGGTAVESLLDTEYLISWITSNDVVSSKINGPGGIMSFLVAGYDSWPVSQKILWLPITFLVQYLTPFNIWDFGLSAVQPWYLINLNFNIIWFISVGPLFLFSIKKAKILRETNYTLRVFWLGMILYIFPIFIYGGAIPRYSMAFFPMLLPRMSYIYDLIRRD